VIAIIGSVVLIFVVLRFTPGRKVFQRLVLKTDSATELGYTSSDPALKTLIGKVGVAKTILRPSGTADIEGQFVDVVTSGDFIPAGTPIIVINVEGMRVVVRKVEKELL
jgi:membrane-bound serine protease (ClpP class)